MEHTTPDLTNLTALEYVARIAQGDITRFRVENSAPDTGVVQFLLYGDQQVPLELLNRWAFIQAIFDGEISVWKTYHAIAPSLTGYCNLITEAANKGRSGSTAKRLQAIAISMHQGVHRRYTQLVGNAVGGGVLSFREEVNRLVERGYRPMLQTLSPNADEPTRVVLGRLTERQFSDVTQRRKDVKVVMRALGEVVNSPESLQADEHLRAFLDARKQAIAAALNFTTALLVADQLLDAQDSGVDILPEGYSDSPAILEDLSFELSKDAWTSVIRTSNSVIVAAVDVMRDVRRESTLVK